MTLTTAQKHTYCQIIYAALENVESNPTTEAIRALHDALNAGAAALENSDGVSAGYYFSSSGGGPKGTP